MSRTFRIKLAGAVAALSVAALSPALATTQTIDATLSTSVSTSTSPTGTISGWSLASTGSNTTSGGTLGVTANVPYTVTVAADKATMSEWDTATSAYVASGRSLTAAMSIVPTAASGTGVPVASLAVGTTAGTLATGVGGGTDTFSLVLSQTTALTDRPLAAGRTYHIVLTYTASPTL